MTAHVIGVLQVELPFPKEQAINTLRDIMPHEESAFLASDLARETKKFRSTEMILAHKNREGSIFIFHFLQEPAGSVQGAVFDIRIEPGPGIAPHTATEEAWHSLSDNKRLISAGAKPQLKKAVVRCTPRTDIIRGQVKSLVDVLVSNQFLLPSIVGGVAAVLVLIGIHWIPNQERPSTLLSLGQLLVPAIIATTLALVLHRKKKQITWVVD